MLLNCTQLEDGLFAVNVNSASGAPATRPDLAGQRFVDPNRTTVSLVDDDGTARLIPDPTTYDALLADWSGIQTLDPMIAPVPSTEGWHVATRVSCASVIIELMQFRLRAGTVIDEFLTADQRLQTEFAYQQPGLLRRTLAQSEDGEWLVIDHWRSAAEADACAECWDENDVAQAFMSMVDRDSVRVKRFRAS